MSKANKYNQYPIGKKLDKEEVRDLLEKAQAGDKEAQDKLVLGHIKLVISIANRYKSFNVDFNELVDEGVIGVLECIEKFDMTKDNSFATYVYYHILKKVYPYALKNTHQTISQVNMAKFENNFIRVNGREPTPKEIAEALKMQEKTVIKKKAYKTTIVSYSNLEDNTDNNSNTKYDGIRSRDINYLTVNNKFTNEYEKEELFEALHKSLNALDESERNLVCRHIGMDSNKKESFVNIAKESNVSLPTIIRRYNIALDKIKKELKKLGYDASVIELFK